MMMRMAFEEVFEEPVLEARPEFSSKRKRAGEEQSPTGKRFKAAEDPGKDDDVTEVID